MRISFDLDGVITNGGAHEFFAEMRKTYPPSEWTTMKHHFYSSRELKSSPYSLMNEDDVGFIITARQPDSQELTREWLQGQNITLPLYFADPLGLIDWVDYPKASVKAARYKALIMKELDIDIHYDNNPYIIKTLRELLPRLQCILVSEEVVSGAQLIQKISAGACSDCGLPLFCQEGCAGCPSCGYSKCG